MDGGAAPITVVDAGADPATLALDEVTPDELALRDAVDAFRRRALTNARRIIHHSLPTKLLHLDQIAQVRAHAPLLTVGL
jgi:hypothetical protein